MNRRTTLVSDENYHVYNRGAHKSNIFLESVDYQRFQLLLYASNSTNPVNLRDLKDKHKGLTFGILRETGLVKQDLVDVFAYALLPNHFHIVLRQKVDGGIGKFMQKLCTGYSMYFNLKHEHSGTLFQGRFKSNHVDTDPYFRWIFAYVHLNPISLVEPRWDERVIKNVARAQKFLNEYAYSSNYDYYNKERPERAVLSYDDGMQYMDTRQDVRGLLESYARGRVLYPTYLSVGKNKM